jgi:hypothetical protein
MKRPITRLYGLGLIVLILFITMSSHAQDTEDLEGWGAVELKPQKNFPFLFPNISDTETTLQLLEIILLKLK